MNCQRNNYSLIGKLILIGCSIICLSFFTYSVVHAQTEISGTRSDGESLVVTNTTEEINGDITNPTALVASPGEDGISLTEAIIASEASTEYDTITFDPDLSGSTIHVEEGLPSIGYGYVTINGDIDDDGTPDITIDGSSSANDNAFYLYGASNVIIKGFNICNYSGDGISISPDTGNDRADVENITIYQNDITVSSSAVQLIFYEQSQASISNVEIDSNNLHDSDCGISISAGMGNGAINNQISNVSIISNTINNPGYTIGIFISDANSSNLSGNTISDVEIRGNYITGHTNSPVLVDASNQASCNNNTVNGLVIAENTIEGTAVTIEILAESGMYSSGNTVSNVTINDNLLTGGGIQFSTATGSNANNNEITSVLVERNEISSGSANGIYVVAGSGGAYNNSIEDLIIRSNFITDFVDAGILLHGYDSGSPNNSITNVTILNQTLIDNGVDSSWAGGINVNTKDSSNTITNVAIVNSILWGNGGDDAIRGSIEPEIVQYNILNDSRFLGTDNNFYEDPDFIDESLGDYHLQSTSPCVDAGDPLSTDLGQQDNDNAIRLVDGNDDSTAVVDLGAWEYNSTAMQEINILGNNISILNGDVIPAAWDGTDLGDAAEENPVQVTFTIENTGTETLELTGVPLVEITGTDAADFTVISQPDPQVNGGQSVTFTIEFTPLDTGFREATVNIVNNDSDEDTYTFAIRGYGDVTPSAEFKNYLPAFFLLLR